MTTTIQIDSAESSTQAEPSLIECRIEGVTGAFDMSTGKLVPVVRRKYGSVELCFEGRWNIPFALIKLHDKDLAVEADAVFDAACRLGEEICRRWNAVSLDQVEAT